MDWNDRRSECNHWHWRHRKGWHNWHDRSSVRTSAAETAGTGATIVAEEDGSAEAACVTTCIAEAAGTGTTDDVGVTFGMAEPARTGTACWGRKPSRNIGGSDPWCLASLRQAAASLTTMRSVDRCSLTLTCQEGSLARSCRLGQVRVSIAKG